MDFRLDGKVALVTGGSRGIGKGIAKAFVDAGAQVMITSRKAESCEAAVKEIGEGAHYEAGHIGKPEDAERVIGATLDRLGRLDVLVNNAATNPYAGPTIDVDLPRWEKTLQVNLTAPLLWTQLCWKAAMKVARCSGLRCTARASRSARRSTAQRATALGLVRYSPARKLIAPLSAPGEASAARSRSVSVAGRQAASMPPRWPS